jgi:hypothetical protein
VPNCYVRQQWLERVEFAGVIANGRVFRGKNGKYVTFLTLGIDYGKYIDITIPRAFAYRDGELVHGRGVVKHQNNSDYIQTSDAKLYTIREWVSQISQT